MKILADATLPLIKELFPAPFQLTRYYSAKEAKDQLGKHQILLCRSTLKINEAFLQHHSLTCIATASSGIDHIDTHQAQQLGIKVFDAKGANAHSVADYVTAILAWLSKSHSMQRKCAGIIGMGRVGKAVYHRLITLGFDVICYDPYLADQNQAYPWTSLKQISECELICIHPNLHDNLPFPSVRLIDEHFLAALQPNTILINTSRGGVVCEESLLKNPTPLYYYTDVYQNEPNINARVIAKATLCTPHIAGHSIEAKNNAVIQLSEQLHAHYGLPFDIHEAPPLPQQKKVCLSKNDWPEEVLALYNPFIETEQLKNSSDLEQTFLSLRAAHQFRHDFNI